MNTKDPRRRDEKHLSYLRGLRAMSRIKRRQPVLTLDRMVELLSYDAETGVFTWRQTRGGRAVAGSVAGRRRPNGYVVISIDLKFHYAHRLAWLYVHGRWPVEQIDHINGNPSDNRISNLREADRCQNRANSRMRKDNKSGLCGVSWSTKDKCWKSFIGFRGEKRCLGSFKRKEDAHAAYLKAATELHGIFAKNHAAKAA